MKKLAIALMAMSMFALPSMNANAQAGTIAGVSAGAFTAGAIVLIVGIGIYEVTKDSDGRPVFVAAPDETPTTTTTAATTTTSGGSSSTTTTL